MRSDAILKLFSVYSLSDIEPNDHVALRFAEHLSLRYHDISSADLAFFLRVGGQLMRQKMEDLWNASDVPDIRRDSNEKESKGKRNIASRDAAPRPREPEAIVAANDERYDKFQAWSAMCLNNPIDSDVSRLKRLPIGSKSIPVASAAASAPAIACPLGQNSRWVRMTAPQIHDSIQSEIARSHEIVASSRELVARSKELRASIKVSRASRVLAIEETPDTPPTSESAWKGEIRLLKQARSWS